MAAVSWVLREDAAADPHPVAGFDFQPRGRRERQEDVGTRSETDQPQASCLGHTVAGFGVRDDAPRDQPRDLAHEHRTARSADADRGLFVVETRLLMSSMQELSFVVMHELDRSIQRRTIHVYIEDGQENRYPHRALLEEHRLLELRHMHHPPLSGRKNVLRTSGTGT